MGFDGMMQKMGARLNRLKGRKGQAVAPPVLGETLRFPYGPFRFRFRLPKGTEYLVLASSDLRTWLTKPGRAGDETVEYIDSEAFKFSYRFYRLQVGEVYSSNIIGYAALTLAPGFSMIANPFHHSQAVGEIFKAWPDGTSLNKFDTRLFRLTENAVRSAKWTHPGEKLAPGEGAIFFNPTSDYKSVSFVGEVVQGNLSMPIPAGFSIRSSQVPQAGHLTEDLHFPIANGDIIHLFDRERQNYVLHPYKEGKWTAGPPVVGVGESFWVAKNEPGSWFRSFVIED